MPAIICCAAAGFAIANLAALLVIGWGSGCAWAEKGAGAEVNVGQLYVVHCSEEDATTKDPELSEER